MAIEFRVLGEVRALRDGQPLVLGSAKPRSVLVALLLDANKVLTVDELVNRVWGEEEPQQARSSLHSYFSRLRSAFDGEPVIARRGHGYVLQAKPCDIDLYEFREAAAAARRSQDKTDALTHFDSAFELWRGMPFAGLDSPWFNDARTAVMTEWESLQLDRNDARLALGHHAELVGELSTQAEKYPLDERLAAQLMLALYRSGRQADALFHFQKVKAVLADDLGIDPGARLRDLHQSILQEDHQLTLPGPRNAVPVARPADTRRVPDEAPLLDQAPSLVPRQLPSPTRAFIGRQSELSALTTALTPSGSASRVVMIAGAGGVGKTSLALHWAHDHADLFPDGQLFVNMRGFDPSLECVQPHQALRSFLIALQVPPQVIPDDPSALAGLYRSVLADKKLLLLIDNARDAEQIIPLLPGNPHCSVIVTSRNKLTRLVSSHDANLLSLDMLSSEEAHVLLTSRLGNNRPAAEAAAVDELVLACGGLPLALTIVVGRAQEHPEFPMTELVAELQEAGSALGAFDVDADLSIRSILSTSCAALSAEQQEKFQLLSLAPGADLSVAAACALTGRPAAETRAALRALERASLIYQQTPGRYRMHDLVRLFARERAEQLLASDNRSLSLHRLADFYLHTAERAAGLLGPGRPSIQISEPVQGSAPLSLPTADDAWKWFISEADNLAASLDFARASGWQEMIWQLTWASSTFYGSRGRAHEMVDVWQEALRAAEQIGDTEKIIIAHRMVGRFILGSGDYDETMKHMNASLTMAENAGNLREKMHGLNAMMEVHWRMERIDLALAAGEEAWEIAQRERTAASSAIAANMAWILALAGQYGRARGMAETALNLSPAAKGKSSPGLVTLYDTLAYISRQTGDLEQAVEYLQTAKKVCSKYEEFGLADVLCSLGETYLELGQYSEARENLERAAKLYKEQRRTQDMNRARVALDQLADAERRLGVATSG